MKEHPDWATIQARVYAFMPEDGALDRITATLPDIIDDAFAQSDCDYSVEELLFMDNEHDDWVADIIVIRLSHDFEASSSEEEKEEFINFVRNESLLPLWKIISNDIKKWRLEVHNALQTGTFWPT